MRTLFVWAVIISLFTGVGWSLAFGVPTKWVKFISETGENTKSPAHHSIFVIINSPKTDIRFEYQMKWGKGYAKLVRGLG